VFSFIVGFLIQLSGVRDYRVQDIVARSLESRMESNTPRIAMLPMATSGDKHVSWQIARQFAMNDNLE